MLSVIAAKNSFRTRKHQPNSSCSLIRHLTVLNIWLLGPVIKRWGNLFQKIIIINKSNKQFLKLKQCWQCSLDSCTSFLQGEELLVKKSYAWKETVCETMCNIWVLRHVAVDYNTDECQNKSFHVVLMKSRIGKKHSWDLFVLYTPSCSSHFEVINLNTLCASLLFRAHYFPLLDKLNCIKKSLLMTATNISTGVFSAEMHWPLQQ